MMNGAIYVKCLGDMSLLGVIILNRLTAHNPVFDVPTRQTMSTNEPHRFSKIRTLLAHL